MKYEMIFGDENLFDGAPEDAEYAGWFCQETRWYMILNGKILFSDGGTWCTSDNPYLSADIAAMRCIIKEPKQWIPVSERLPGLDGGPYVSKPVLAFDKYDDVVFAKYVKSGYWVILYIDERREHGEITHWMPLPAAPEIHK